MIDDYDLFDTRRVNTNPPYLY